MAFRLPGQVNDRTRLWQVLANGVDTTGPLTADRIPLLGAGSDLAEFAGGWLAAVDRFDAPFFGMNGREARSADPQQRLLLETAWHALEDAAIAPETLRGTRTGVFVGSHACDYLSLSSACGLEVDGYWNAGLHSNMLANRISHFFDLTGPSLTVNTACSSSLEALVLAADLLRSGRCELAIVGGVNLILTSEIARSALRAGLLSPDGKCRPFDDAANGFVRGEGIAALVVRPLEDARAAGNPIHAILRNAMSAHAGRAASLSSPRLDRQRDLIVATHREGTQGGAFVSLMEAHAAGSRIGDAVEWEAIEEACRIIEPARRSGVSVGSLKANFGHLESAAGIAGVIKLCVCFAKGQIPPTAHHSRRSSLIRAGHSPLRVAERLESWTGDGGPLRAGVSSFGFGGAMAHVILESPPHEAESAATDREEPATWVVMSARDPDRLAAAARRWLLEHERAPLGDLAFTSREGRTAFPHRTAFPVASHDDLRRRLEEFIRVGPARGDGSVIGAATTAGGADPAVLSLVRVWLSSRSAEPLRGISASGRMTSDAPKYEFAPHAYWPQS